MLVKNWMSKEVITIGVDASMHDGMKLMKEHGIRRLPVLKKGKLVGIVTDRDLKRASASDATTLEIHELFYIISQIKIKKIMTKDPITVPFDFTVEETAELLLKYKISGVPVVDYGGKLVGILNQTDLFRVLISLTSIGQRGIQFGLKIDNQPGSIKAVLDTIQKYGARIANILGTFEQVIQGQRVVYIRIYGIDRVKLPDLKAALNEQTELLYMVDHKENRREIFQE